MAISPDAEAAITTAEQEVGEAAPAAVPEAPSTTTTTAALSKWPWWGTFVIAVLLLAVYIGFKWMLWTFVLGSAEDAEGDDFDQLKAIADEIETIVVLLVGAIFGVGATQGVAAGAAKAADENKKAAEDADAVAKANAEAATANLARAESFEASTLQLATAITAYRDAKAADDSRYVEHAQYAIHSDGGYHLADDDLREYDADLDRLAEVAERIVRRLR